MKNFKPLTITFLLIIALTLSGWYSSKDLKTKTESDSTIVVLKFKAQPEKGKETVEALTQLIEQVKKEPHFVSIKLHVGEKDETDIMLYEEWEDVNYYNTKHYETNHLQEFMTASRNFLTGPPDVSFWKVNQVFE